MIVTEVIGALKRLTLSWHYFSLPLFRNIIMIMHYMCKITLVASDF